MPKKIDWTELARKKGFGELKELFIDYYYRRQYTLQQIGDALSVDPNTILGEMHRLGLPRREKGWSGTPKETIKKKLLALPRELIARSTAQELAEQVGSTDRHYVSDLLRREKIPYLRQLKTPVKKGWTLFFPQESRELFLKTKAFLEAEGGDEEWSFRKPAETPREQKETGEKSPEESPDDSFRSNVEQLLEWP